MPLDREQVINALRTVKEPELFKDLVTLNLVRGVRVEGANVGVLIELPHPSAAVQETIQRDVTAALRRIGAQQVQVDFGGSAAQAQAQPPRVLPQVKNVIAVGAGKGGVGKSTLALNLAVGLARTGAAVGLMDGDIYGPSMPTMLGLKGKAPQLRGSHILPFHSHGIYAITIGALVEQDKPLIWRGPMAHGAFKQLFVDNTEWPNLDYLIVDLPPGTGDVPLTLCQLLPITGAVIVATPQQVALDDAVRAARMFQQLGAPILGVVENMSYMPGPNGTAIDIFGRGGAEKAAQRLNLPFLGSLALHPELRINSDAGDPTANFAGPNANLRTELESLVRNLAAQVSLRNTTAPQPTLTIT
jgi:ATP-binding protein involved in chromosome partitioning